MYRSIAIALVLASYATATPVPQEDSETIDAICVGNVCYEPTTTTTGAPTADETASSTTGGVGSEQTEGYVEAEPTPTDGPNRNTVYPVGPFGHWENVSCEAGKLTSVANNPIEQWTDADAANAYEDMWTAFEKDNKSLKLSDFIGDYFKARPSLACELLDHENCQTTINCGQGSSPNAPVNSPAGYLIVNSMVYVHNFHAAFYKGLKSALNFMQGDIGKFSETFAPQFDPMKDDKRALDIMNMFLSLLSAPTFNSWLKRVPAFKNNPNMAGTIKDTVNPLVNQGITYVKDSMVAVNVLKVQNTIDSFLTEVVKGAIDALAEINRKNFETPRSLRYLIQDGTGWNPGESPNALDISDHVMRSLWAFMIPFAWAHSSVGNPIVFIMSPDGFDNYNNKCEADGPPPELWSKWGQKDDAMDNTKVCIDGRPYWIMAVDEPRNGNCQAVGALTCSTPRPILRIPPGLKELDGKKWGGITKEDLVRSAMNSKAANGGRNGWQALNGLDWKALNDVQDNGVRAKGVVNIPICSFREAADNAGWAGPNGSEMNRGAANYPCN